MRLIDADFLKRRINETMSSEYVYSTIGLKNLIEEAPTIAAEDVKHGKWRLSKYYPHIISCDVCGEPYELSNSMEHWNYCPHCGAKMLPPTQADDGVR